MGRPGDNSVEIVLSLHSSVGSGNQTESARLVWPVPSPTEPSHWPHLCLFQENYYKPPAQDACLPCDCFPHGSHSRACDMDTGQCACKPGVIGRQCNRCDNPFAEVTSLGCEGLLLSPDPFLVTLQNRLPCLTCVHEHVHVCACISLGLEESWQPLF